jgi:hypothetical protein
MFMPDFAALQNGIGYGGIWRNDRMILRIHCPSKSRFRAGNGHILNDTQYTSVTGLLVICFMCSHTFH